MTFDWSDFMDHIFLKLSSFENQERFSVFCGARVVPPDHLLFQCGKTKNKNIMSRNIIEVTLIILRLEFLVQKAHLTGSLTIYPDTEVSRNTEMTRYNRKNNINQSSTANSETATNTNIDRNIYKNPSSLSSEKSCLNMRI
jgi:hypothetical protein